MVSYALFPTKPVLGEDGVNRVGFYKVAIKDLTPEQLEIVTLLKEGNRSPETASKIGSLLKKYYQDK